MRSSMLSILPVCSPAVIMRMIMLGKDGVLAQRGGDALAALDVAGGGLDGFFHDHIADGLGDDLQHLQDGHAAADQRGQRAGEAGEADLVGDGAEDRQLDAVRIPELAARLGLDEIEPAVDGRRRRRA